MEKQVVDAKTVYGIKQLAEATGHSDVYIRRSILAGKLESTKVPVAPESKTLKHQITGQAYLDWRAARVPRRGDTGPAAGLRTTSAARAA